MCVQQRTCSVTVHRHLLQRPCSCMHTSLEWFLLEDVTCDSRISMPSGLCGDSAGEKG